MKPPHPILLASIALILIACGWMLWQDEGAVIWLQQIVAYCL